MMMSEQERLKKALSMSGRTELEFFQIAYLWRFKKVGNCVNDVCQFRLHGIVPTYIKEFLDLAFS